MGFGGALTFSGSTPSAPRVVSVQPKAARTRSGSSGAASSRRRIRPSLDLQPPPLALTTSTRSAFRERRKPGSPFSRFSSWAGQVSASSISMFREVDSPITTIRYVPGGLRTGISGPRNPRLLVVYVKPKKAFRAGSHRSFAGTDSELKLFFGAIP